MSAKLEYTKLDESCEEIRLFDLHPGRCDDVINFTLRHASFRVPQHKQRDRLTLDELRNTLPPGWNAVETGAGQYRYLFEAPDGSTSWKHPDPDCDPLLWQPLEELPTPGFEPRFEALSYTWGPLQPSETALVEYYPQGSTTSPRQSVLELGPNLTAALKALRHTDRSRTLWVDAVCINQLDNKEREKQLKRMAAIYRWALRVVVWLGPSTPRTQLAMKALSHISSQIEVCPNHTIFPSPGATNRDWSRATCAIHLDDATCAAIHEFLESSWFDRLWVWQEISLANSQALFCCGQYNALCRLISKGGECLYWKISQFSHSAFRKRWRLLRPLFDDPRGKPVSSCLWFGRTRLCSEPKDRIYGMLSLSDELASLVTPNYDTAVTCQQVFREVFINYTLSSRRLDLLAGCGQHLSRHAGPSWCPDWSCPMIYDQHSLNDTSQTASGSSGSVISFIEPGILRVTGVQVGSVTSVAEYPGDAEMDTFRKIRLLEPRNLLNGHYHPTRCTLLEAFYNTIMAGFTQERFPEAERPAYASESWQKHYLNMRSSLETSERVSLASSELEIHPIRPASIINGRTSFQTSSGHLGIGPAGTQAGDIAVVLLGLNAPMILRPTDRSGLDSSCTAEKAYTILGTAYVHGIASTEALLGPLPAGWHQRYRDGGIRGWRVSYFNDDSGVEQNEDPRLAPLPGHLWHIEDRRSPHSPYDYVWYKNLQTGEEMNCDPRMSADALKERGIPLRTFDLY